MRLNVPQGPEDRTLVQKCWKSGDEVRLVGDGVMAKAFSLLRIPLAPGIGSGDRDIHVTEENDQNSIRPCVSAALRGAVVQKKTATSGRNANQSGRA